MCILMGVAIVPHGFVWFFVDYCCVKTSPLEITAEFKRVFRILE